MDQQVASADADRHREHDVLKLLCRDRTRVWDWDVDVRNFLDPVNGLIPAQRKDGCDALRIRARQFLSILEAAEIESFPNLRHLFPSSRAGASLRLAVSTRPILPPSIKDAASLT